MGESIRKQRAALMQGNTGNEPQVVDTLGGRMHVRWVSSCPLEYRSGNAPDKRDVLGTLMLGLLAGHRHYAGTRQMNYFELI